MVVLPSSSCLDSRLVHIFVLGVIKNKDAKNLDLDVRCRIASGAEEVSSRPDVKMREFTGKIKEAKKYNNLFFRKT